jgi:hypothetical protein
MDGMSSMAECHHVSVSLAPKALTQAGYRQQRVQYTNHQEKHAFCACQALSFIMHDMQTALQAYWHL